MIRRALFATAVAAVALTPATATAKSAKLAVATYNIHHAAGVDGRLDVKRIAAELRRPRPT